MTRSSISWVRRVRPSTCFSNERWRATMRGRPPTRGPVPSGGVRRSARRVASTRTASATRPGRMATIERRSHVGQARAVVPDGPGVGRGPGVDLLGPGHQLLAERRQGGPFVVERAQVGLGPVVELAGPRGQRRRQPLQPGPVVLEGAGVGRRPLLDLAFLAGEGGQPSAPTGPAPLRTSGVTSAAQASISASRLTVDARVGVGGEGMGTAAGRGAEGAGAGEPGWGAGAGAGGGGGGGGDGIDWGGPELRPPRTTIRGYWAGPAAPPPRAVVLPVLPRWMTECEGPALAIRYRRCDRGLVGPAPAQTSGQPAYWPRHTTPQPGQVQDESPAPSMVAAGLDDHAEFRASAHVTGYLPLRARASVTGSGRDEAPAGLALSLYLRHTSAPQQSADHAGGGPNPLCQDAPSARVRRTGNRSRGRRCSQFLGVFVLP